MSELSPEDRVRRAERAERAYAEFVKPEIDFAREHYGRRIVEIATSETDPRKRTDKITSLSTALRVIEEVEKGIFGMMRDGEEASHRLIRAEKIEQLSPAKRRLLNIGSY